MPSKWVPSETSSTADAAQNWICLRLFKTITAFATPQDVTLQELRLELSFPAHATTDRIHPEWPSPDDY